VGAAPAWQPEANLLGCGRKGTEAYDIYQREVRDLPWSALRATVMVELYRCAKANPSGSCHGANLPPKRYRKIDCSSLKVLPLEKGKKKGTRGGDRVYIAALNFRQKN